MMTRRSRVLFTLSLLAVGTITPASASLIVTPSSQAINVGGTASVNIDISGLGNGVAPALAAFTGLLVSYNSSFLNPTGVMFSNRLGDPTDPSQTLLLSNVFLPSAIQLDGLSFLTNTQLFAAQANANGQFTIATISFAGIASGTSPINVTYGALSDERGNTLTEDSRNGSITVGITPEPGTLSLLVAGGFLGFAALRKKLRE